MPSILKNRSALIYFEKRDARPQNTPVPQPEPSKPRKPSKKYGKWDETKDDALKAMWGRVPVGTIAAKIGMSQTACYNRAGLYGLAMIP